MFLASTRYALLACRYLARGYFENKYRAAPDIAEMININVRALMPALRQLTRAGILRSRVGGKEPGFIFARPPREITLFEVLAALEGDNEVVCCKEINPELNCDCNPKNGCFIYTILSDLGGQVKMTLAKINMEEYSKN